MSDCPIVSASEVVDGGGMIIAMVFLFFPVATFVAALVLDFKNLSRASKAGYGLSALVGLFLEGILLHLLLTDSERVLAYCPPNGQDDTADITCVSGSCWAYELIGWAPMTYFILFLCWVRVKIGGSGGDGDDSGSGGD